MSHFEDMDKSYVKNLTRTEYSRLENINFQAIPPLDIANNELSPIAEYYIAPFIFLVPEMCLIIPLTHINLNDDALRQLLCHFQSIHVVTSKGNPVELRLENLNPKSKEKFTLLMSENKINPFVLDLYQFHGVHTASGDFKYVRFNQSINPTYEDSIHSIHIQEFDEIWSHIRQIYSEKKYVYLCPNWLFSDQLSNSIALNYFSTACKEVYLSIDNTTSHINGIILSIDYKNG
ncbi:hypothetical protein [Paenibacillus aceris]|uniref:Uncharacterized protein n=1 Tax=Paenibacillus aceris TaxID=869555 RepID=A0ABS4HYW3_9BACL|nr:hypothetical protein [Paenibacillus aceris]MBP1963506.1 hypothetical protein [Paenibacillus aceris]NHW36771.1 hypothetical protein [Paenibacillus aceris]